jgi:hypothetical protein
MKRETLQSVMRGPEIKLPAGTADTTIIRKWYVEDVVKPKPVHFLERALEFAEIPREAREPIKAALAAVQIAYVEYIFLGVNGQEHAQKEALHQQIQHFNDLCKAQKSNSFRVIPDEEIESSLISAIKNCNTAIDSALPGHGGRKH